MTSAYIVGVSNMLNQIRAEYGYTITIKEEPHEQTTGFWVRIDTEFINIPICLVHVEHEPINMNQQVIINILYGTVMETDMK